MGVISLFASIALTTLPETLHQFVPQTAEEAAVFGHKSGFFSLAQEKMKEPEVEMVAGNGVNGEANTTTTTV